MADNTEGLIPIQSGIVPNNLNPRAWITDNRYVKGAPQTFDSLATLIAFHPFKMSRGMNATVLNFPEISIVSSFRLIGDPAFMIDGAKETIVTIDNYTTYWELVDEVRSTAITVYMYAPDGPGGGAPIYPYTVSSELTAGWEPVFNSNKGHRWMRFRTDDVDTNADGVYDNWTQPIRVSDAFTTGDYIENRFKRQAVDVTVYSSEVGLVSGNYYSVLTGTIDKDDNGIISVFGIGFTFEYIVGAGISYTFNTATVQETVPAPPRTVNGLPNNDPSADGWQDTIPTAPVGEQLWQIWAQKSVYGQLKSDWRIKQVNEDPDFIRYSNSASPHPDTIVNTTTVATLGSAGDLALIAEGWVSAYDNNVFMAQRDLISVGLYTAWSIQKIDEESGEFTDNVFKLFDLNLDSDDISLQPPVGRDALAEGWSDAPITEPSDGTQINYISTARKFFDGTLKTPWSSPVPYTGKDAWNDVISSDTGDDFKYDKLGVVTPTQIVLTSKLYKGIAEMWISNTITYVWEIVFNGAGGLPPGTQAGLQGGQPLFYYNAVAIDNPGDPTHIQIGQFVTVLPDAIDGKGIIKCTQTIEISAGNTIDFIEEFSILDVTDGNDAKALQLNTDTYVLVYDGTSTSISPSTVSLRGYFSNLINQTWRWWIDVGNTGTWIEIVTRNGYSKNGLILDFDTSLLGDAGWGVNADWSQDGTKQENRFAVTNYNGNPDSPSVILADEEFRDIVTITKLSSAGVGSDGDSAVAIVLDNETHSVVLNSTTGVPQVNQIGLSSPASTKVLFYDGLIPRVYVPAAPAADEWTISSITVTALDQAGVSVNADVTAGQSDGTPGDAEAQVYVSTWVSTNFPTAATISAQLTINISYNGGSYTKVFTLSSTLDAPGAVILDIDSDKGFIFDVSDRTDKTLTADVIDDTGNFSEADFYFNWYIEGVWSGWSVLGVNTKIITHTNVRISADVKCAISTNPAANPDTQAFRKRTIRFSDIQDGKVFIFYNDVVSPTPAKPIGDGRQNSQLGTWYRSDDVYWATNTIEWASDGNESNTDGTWVWSEPYRVGGEKGDQGENGGFEMVLFKLNSIVKPDNTFSIDTHINAGWSATPPTPTPDSTMYMISRFYKGEDGGFTVAFDSNGIPSWNGIEDNSDPSTKALGGSTWTAAKTLILTPATPLDGDAGDAGDRGWSPVFSTYNYSPSIILRLIDWTGGQGTKPGFVGYFVTPTGLSSSPQHSGNIKGDTGEDVQYIAPLTYNATNTQVAYTNNSGRVRLAIVNMRGVFVSSGPSDSSSTAYLQFSVNDGTWVDIPNMNVTIGTTNNDVANEFSLDYHTLLSAGVKIEFRRRIAFGSNQSVRQERIIMAII